MDASIRNDSVFREWFNQEDPGLAQILKSMPEWFDLPVSISCVLGGLSNQVYRFEVNGLVCIARIPGKQSSSLWGNIDFETENTVLAGELGIGPKVLYQLKDGGLIIEFIDGIQLTSNLLQDSNIVNSVIDSLKKLHGGAPFKNDFSSISLMDRFLNTLNSLDYPTFSDWHLYRNQLLNINDLLESYSPNKVPCHNDIFPKNWIIDVRGNPRLIDFEYSGNNDPAFELATLFVESKWDEETMRQVCVKYFDDDSPKHFSSVWMQSILFDSLWSLYSLIRAGLNPQSDGLEIGTLRWRRAKAKLASIDYIKYLKILKS